jgi:hypothetical protein
MKNIETILGSEVLSEEVKDSINEAWDAKVAIVREELTAELREEFAGRYENDKTQIVEAMDAMLQDVIKSELNEFAQDRAKLAEERVALKSAIAEQATMLEEFVNAALKKEITELREDREAQKENFGKLEGFVLEQLTKELNEFHDDKRSLAEQKVKMVQEGKKVIAEARTNFVTKSAAKIESLLESVITSELSSLKEDIQTAKENDFGRKIFETFAAEFMTSTLAEGTQVAELSKQIEGLNLELAESKDHIAKGNAAIMEAKRTAKIQQDISERKAVMSEMMAPLAKEKREVMHSLLESVKTAQLKNAFSKYLPIVLSEESMPAKASSKAKLVESTGDKFEAQPTQVDGAAEIINLKKLAGLG